MPFDLPSTSRPPSALFGALFRQVQSERLFADSKTFPDLIPRASPEMILEAFQRAGSLDRAGLQAFIETHFTHAPNGEAAPCRPGQSLASRIRELWDVFVRRPSLAAPQGSLLETSHRYIVPGGRFAEAYYWDSYFSLLGLITDGREAEAKDIVQGFAALIDGLGFIPNGTRTYYLGRSQPPLFYLMGHLVEPAEPDPAHLTRLVSEHAFWMAGAGSLEIGAAHRRVVRLPDGSILNRYWDDAPGPRDEAYAEDCSLADRSGRPHEEIYHDLRAGAESGWDFSSRWLADPSDLGSIRTTAILPVDLNAFLWGLENDIQLRARALGETEVADTYGVMAENRAKAMRAWGWNAEAGIFCDYDWKRGARLPGLTAALLTPLFVGLATPTEAASAAAAAEARLLRAGGLLTTPVATSQQWDAPNGWAPLQWIAVKGLVRYGHTELAETIAERWLAMVGKVFGETGQLFEKYDVEAGSAGGGGEYAPQNGFGWTNGVTRALMQWLGPNAQRFNTVYRPRASDAAQSPP